ncbi:uroporphyrinogen-III synthase [Methylophilus medardicus]|uniref:Uroporphyrinogen-III synthase n=1 Tax=Methylophilus medardicus TaxID=2588534 RepID=A0A5B8CVH0_9PROT|nr:uroporphyrinogen-III synthase [Methylophilus medardicus]QDC45243.1 uroporphyrinogen-III synthase [Methylophilus medardicus]QDC50250.1 uroporphyrinogen-III synthase [Methylophilus medardicus]QDC53955.1 uroporphyrinogen-III synthase [Methylophilus medardicus]
MAAIHAAGGQVISFPLLDIEGLPDLTAFHAAITPLQQFDWAVFISSNAVQHGMPLLKQAGLPSALQFAAIGPTTAASLQTFGVSAVLTPLERFDSESLLALPALQQMQGQRVLIVRGVGGRELLANTLGQRGAEVVFGECYRRVNPQSNAQVLAAAHAAAQLHAIVITSTEALRFLLQLAGDADWLPSVPLFTNHARIAEQAREAGLMAFSADQPGDAAMLRLLETHL